MTFSKLPLVLTGTQEREGGGFGVRLLSLVLESFL